MTQIGITGNPRASDPAHHAVAVVPRQIPECLAQRVTDRALEKTFENQAMPIVQARLVLVLPSIAVAQLSLAGNSGPTELIQPALPSGHPIERAVARPTGDRQRPHCTLYRRVHSSGAARRLSTGAATRSLLM